MKKQITIIPSDVIGTSILFIRGEKVMLDADLARLYGVETKVLLQAVKRNLHRFPEDFMFRLSYQEVKYLRSQLGITSEKHRRIDSGNINSEPFQGITNLRSQIVTSSLEHTVITEFSPSEIFSILNHGGRRALPYLFTEQGIAMLSTVLNSPRAIAVNVEIIRTFVRLRKMIASHKDLSEKIEQLEAKYDGHFKVIFDALREMITPTTTKKKPIGFAQK